MAQNFERFTEIQAEKYSKKLGELARKYAPSNHIKKSIKNYWRKSSGKYVLTASAGPTAEGDARARELGSGIHAKVGPKNKYPILPRRGKYLVFPWDKAYPEIPRTADGRVLLKKVNHPGVEAANAGQGYLSPAAKDVIQELKDKFAIEARAYIIADLKEATRTQNA